MRWFICKENADARVFFRASEANDGLFFDLVLHAIAFPLDDEGFGMVQEAIQDSGGEGAVVVKDFGPIFESAIGRDDEGAAFVALADDLEE